MDYFAYRDGELHADGVPASEIAREYGTPVYVYSGGAFADGLRALKAAFGGIPVRICYSVKAASNLTLLGIVSELGMGADIVSGGELFRALRAGIPAGNIVFSGVGKTAREMAEALDAGILMFNLESEGEMELLAKVAAEMGKVAPVSFRVNPDVDPHTHPYIATGLRESKFGIPHGEAPGLFARALGLPSLRVLGLDCHIGSQLTTTGPFADAVKVMANLLETLRAAGADIRYLDLGGGLGIRYKDEVPPTPSEYAHAVTGALAGFPGLAGLTLVIEPGRSVAGNASILLTRVLYLKRTPAKSFVIVDAAMNDLVRPSLYGAYHAIRPVRESAPDAPVSTVSVVGPVCESGDFLARDRELPVVAPCDLLAVFGAGAYGFTMSSNYNSRPRAAEILAEAGSARVVRLRETYEDLVRGEPI
ncbi:MAG: diaminopimelate decarboxylase [Deltaproteobacteria bacterium]|nr:diaminopimelate decarboxylase [Deltaproteobacteria bacterium]